jgi:predicted tellurium resistance membrane protein TerC
MNFYAEVHGLFTIHGIISLFILSLLELVLGVDNIIFISLIITKIPEEKRFKARVTALSLAFLMRILILFFLVWLSRITTSLFTVCGFQVSIRDILFLTGGAFLMYSTTKELINHIQLKKNSTASQIVNNSFIFQIVLVDILFSFDSIFTAIGINPNFIIMVLAIGIGMLCMIYLSGQTSKFIEKNPTIKTITLGFILLVGFLLITQAFHWELPKEYFYAAFAFALIVEGLNIRRHSVK